MGQFRQLLITTDFQDAKGNSRRFNDEELSRYTESGIIDRATLNSYIHPPPGRWTAER
jgi:hypothetical protein